MGSGASGYQPYVPFMAVSLSVCWTIDAEEDVVRLRARRWPSGWLTVLAIAFSLVGVATGIVVYMRLAGSPRSTVGVVMLTVAVPIWLLITWASAVLPNWFEARRGDLLRFQRASGKIELPVLGITVDRADVIRLELAAFRWSTTGARGSVFRDLIMVISAGSGERYQLLLRCGVNLKSTGRRLAEALDVPFVRTRLGPLKPGTGIPVPDARGQTG